MFGVNGSGLESTGGGGESSPSAGAGGVKRCLRVGEHPSANCRFVTRPIKSPIKWVVMERLAINNTMMTLIVVLFITYCVKIEQRLWLTEDQPPEEL